MLNQAQANILNDKPFPLKRYYILYAGIGGIVFYAMLFSFFIHAERQALHDQYIAHLVEKANAFYRDIDRDVLQENNASLHNISQENQLLKSEFRHKVESLIQTDFSFAKVKVFNPEGVVLYNHKDPSNEGSLYDAIEGEGFQTALANGTFSKLEDDGEKRFMEVYLPAHAVGSAEVVAVLEVYEDVTRFEAMVFAALKQALVLPTLIFMAFNILLFVIIIKADRIISSNTLLLINVRQQMEKYISKSATQAIYSAVQEDKELFRGEMQTIVTFFSDIRGFTSYSENHEPEVVVREINQLFELQAEIIHQHHGIIDKFVGDEIMALFPANNVSQAVKASLDILKAMQNHPDIHFDVGIGVHMGEALVGSIGTHDRRDYTAIGNTVNTGARFCGAAKGGEVIISDVVYAQLDVKMQQQFSLSQPLKLKGKSENIITYQG
ncbi:MAG: adenylate/guanylate cyclase domain-containing protein [Mariprofundaceae bacterium]|nr:adenylate/guanylate cyclase domain-containing protein [Mariprofundaceae bacterium]